MRSKIQISSIVAFTQLMTLAPAVHADSALEPAVSFIAGLLNVGVFPESDAYTTDDDIVIVADDGVELAANVFVPTGVAGAKPAVIFVNSWALNEYEYLAEAARFAEEGYVVLSYSTRGFGQSGGLINTAGPQDMADFSRVVDYLLANFEVDPSRIGTAGISYGAGISLLGAAHDSRIKAAAAMSTWGSLSDALYGEETPRLVWGELLNLSGDLLGNPDPEILETWEDVLAGENLAEVYAWTDIRSPINYVGDLNSNGTAVYIAQNWGDNLFQVNSVLDMFAALSGPKHIDLQAGTHAGPELFGMIGGGDTHVLNNLHRWFAEHVKGVPGAMEGQLPVHMKVKFTSGYQEYSAYPVPEAVEHTWYLKPRTLLTMGGLSSSPYTGWDADNSINSLFDTAATTAIPLASQLFEQLNVPVTADVSDANNSFGIVYVSGFLGEDLNIRGKPELSVTIEPKDEDVQLVAYLYDMNLLGEGTLITHTPVTLHDVEVNTPIQVNLDITATAYDVPAGHRIALVLDTKDLLYAAPEDSLFAVDVEYSASQQNTLTLPAID